MHIGLVLTHAYKIIKYQSTIGVGDGGREGTYPQKFVKIFSGQSLCRIRAFFGQNLRNLDNFSGNYNKKLGYFDNSSSKIHAKFGHFVIFFYIFFSGKNVKAPTPRHSTDEAINEQKNIKYNSKLITTITNAIFNGNSSISLINAQRVKLPESFSIRKFVTN